MSKVQFGELFRHIIWDARSAQTAWGVLHAHELRRQQHCVCCCVTFVPPRRCYPARASPVVSGAGALNSSDAHWPRLLQQAVAAYCACTSRDLVEELCKSHNWLPLLDSDTSAGRGRCAPQSGACGAAAGRRAWGSRTSPPQPPRPAQARPERAATDKCCLSLLQRLRSGRRVHACSPMLFHTLTSCSTTELAVGVAIVLSSDSTRWSEDQAHWQRQACCLAPLLHI